MPVTPTYPGVYIEEVSSGVRTIVAVATSITAFIGRAARGPSNEPIKVLNFGAFQRQFGGLDTTSMMSYAVQQFFNNGGSEAIIVRVANANDAKRAQLDAGGLKLQASGEGKWGNNLRAVVDHFTRDEADAKLFNLRIQEIINDEDGNPQKLSEEVFRNVSIDPDSPRYVRTVIDEESMLVDTADTAALSSSPGDGSYDSAGDGVDGSAIRDEDILGEQLDKTGMYALEEADLFNILCIPPKTRTDGITETVYKSAAKYCSDRRAILLVDPAIDTAKTVTHGNKRIEDLRKEIGTNNSKNVAFFFPNLKMPDELKENRLHEFVPCGAVAGVMATTDLQRGVWKAPAGIEASLVGVSEFTFKMTDGENGALNPKGVNCMRNFPVYGNVVWGSRTLAGDDRLASEWKYLAVRRTALFIQESLYRGTQWAVFEPNDEPLWAEVRLNVGAFMQNLFRQGAFQGRSPRERLLRSLWK
ncbi:phage tail sheath protein [Rhodopirellula maiorica SM1]|uniref:Phage tail sheath protein n=1 Tax=Rhodopirellula maiorica SM1 TaxID=1265738 RepID=M5RD94_9BACT|nr:phage tail sheath subtilisin-like domain-containing protein [Rhodopirellula maiorica]EMI17345.1 phage tail sheath protein [Rhodopirellula maiorica SM1]